MNDDSNMCVSYVMNLKIIYIYMYINQSVTKEHFRRNHNHIQHLVLYDY